MPEVMPLRSDHGPALLAFEQVNRAYFAATVPDRGEDFFTTFDDRLRELLADQEAGTGLPHVVLGDEGEVLARINLWDVAGGSAELGYRVAEHAAGRGLCTWAVREVCALAAGSYGLIVLRARTTVDNAASRAVLARIGFAETGRTLLSGRPGLTFRRSLLDLPGPRGTEDIGTAAVGADLDDLNSPGPADS